MIVYDYVLYPVMITVHNHLLPVLLHYIIIIVIFRKEKPSEEIALLFILI